MKQNRNTIALALMAIAFVQLSASAITPALSNIRPAFPEVPAIFISMLSTLPSLLSAPFTLISGFLAGKKMRYRTLELIGVFCMLISGVAPFFSNNFYMILFWRSLFGIGTGLSISLLMPLTMNLFSHDAQGQMGSNTIATNVGAIIFQLLGGLLCTKFGWRSAFLIYILIFPLFIIVSKYLPEPSFTVQTVSSNKNDTSCGSIKSVIRWCLLNFCYMIFFYALVTQTSDIITQSNFGSAATAGTVLAIFTMGGVVGGVIFRRSKKLLKYVFAAVYVCMALGFFIMAISPNVVLLTLGEFIAGIGFGLFSPAVAMSAGLCVPSVLRTKASSILAIAGNLGGFASTFVLSALGNFLGFSGGRFSFWASFAFFTIIFLASPLFKICGIANSEQA